MTTSGTTVQTLTIDWGEAEKGPGGARQWLGAWLVSRDGTEGDFFYDGPGGGQTTHTVPPEAVGLRLRWWPPLPAGQANELQQGRTNASRPVFFDEHAGARLEVSALAIAP